MDRPQRCRFGDLQPFTNNSGTPFRCQLRRRLFGFAIGLWNFDCADAIDRDGLSEATFASQQRSAGIDYALDNATDLPVVGGVRVLRTFGAWNIHNQLFFESLEGRDYRWLWAGWFNWLGLVALSLVGAVVEKRSVWRNRWPLLVPLGVVFATALASYGNQRFRAIAEPGMLVLAAIGLVVLVDRLRRQGTQAPSGSS